MIFQNNHLCLVGTITSLFTDFRPVHGRANIFGNEVFSVNWNTWDGKARNIFAVAITSRCVGAGGISFDDEKVIGVDLFDLDRIVAGISGLNRSRPRVAFDAEKSLILALVLIHQTLAVKVGE